MLGAPEARATWVSHAELRAWAGTVTSPTEVASKAPNMSFAYLDGLLARLRREIPDPEARFAAYRALDFPGVLNYRRLHELEIRRLEAMDRKFDIGLGAFILDNFRQRRILHTTARPDWQRKESALRAFSTPSPAPCATSPSPPRQSSGYAGP